MRFSAIIGASLVALAVGEPVVYPAPAPVITNNPIGKTYCVTFDYPFFTGNITATSGADGKGVDFVVSVAIDLEKDPKFNKTDTGDYAYHIHDQPVPSDGNCTKTLAHLDYYEVGQNKTCNRDTPEYCEGGDLAGKHGMIQRPTDLSQMKIVYDKKYIDLYLSTKEGEHNFFGNRSIVFHRPDKTRLGCANFMLKNHNATAGNATSPVDTKNSYSSSAISVGLSFFLALGSFLAVFAIAL